MLFRSKIFLYQSFFLVGKGIIIGNIIGLSFAFAQKYFSLVELNPDVYYVSTVPLHISLSNIILINIISIFISIIILIGPTYLITKISPAKSIKFE